MEELQRKFVEDMLKTTNEAVFAMRFCLSEEDNNEAERIVSHNGLRDCCARYKFWDRGEAARNAYMTHYKPNKDCTCACCVSGVTCPWLDSVRTRTGAFDGLQHSLSTTPKSRKELFAYGKRVHHCSDSEQEAELQRLVKEKSVTVSSDGSHFVVNHDLELDPFDYWQCGEHLEARYLKEMRLERIQDRIDHYSDHVEYLKRRKTEEDAKLEKN